MGTGYKGGASNHHSISDNKSSLTSTFKFTNGYFGTQGYGKKGKNRHIESDDPVKTAKEFYNKASYGAKEEPMKNGKGVIASLSDGTRLSYRERSSSDGTPVVEINITKSNNSDGIKKQKIHFIKGEN